MPIEIRRVTPDQWQVLRDLRLRSLQEAPYAFGATYAEDAALTYLKDSGQ